MEDLTFFLNFKNDSSGEIQITEVVKFDGASFTAEQDKDRYGRDISFGNEEVSLVFYDGLYDTTANPLQLPSGSIVYNLTMGLDFLLDYYKRFGFESEVEFIIKKDDVVFTVGILDFQLARTDQLTFFECKIIQENNRSIINRRKDTNIDVFSSKDLDDNDILPLSTESILLKAKPLIQVSNWGQQTTRRYTNVNTETCFNPFQQVNKYGIEDTLSFLEPYTSDPKEETALVRASTLLTNITIDVHIKYVILATGGAMHFEIQSGPALGPVNNNPFSESLPVTGGITHEYNKTIVLENPISPGEVFTAYLRHFNTINIDVIECSVNVVATSIGIDSVIKGVRYVDLFKQSIKSINGMTLDSPRFDVGGEFYDQFAFNGKLIRQFTDQAFYVKFKDLMEGIAEVNADYQINDNSVFMGLYEDFYVNTEIGAFLQVPFDDFETGFNDRYAIINLNYKYETFEQDRDEANTIDGVHTNSQYLLPNKFVENQKNISVNHIRDPFAIESARRQGVVAKEDTSLDNDDKVFVVDVVPLEPGTNGQFANFLAVQNIDGNVNILNSDGENNAIFQWHLLGFRVGDFIQISNDGGSYLTYSVVNITPTVITVSGASIPDGTHTLKFIYPFTDVSFVNRTNEGFDLIENLQIPDNFANLKYTIRRNLFHWEQYLHTACRYRPNSIIKNTYFKNNGEAITQFEGGAIYTEKEDINVEDLRKGILEPIIYKTKVVADFDTVKTFLDDLKEIRGFIRISDTNGRMIKIHPTTINYMWSTGVLEIDGESRIESEFVEVNKIGSELVEINEVGYDVDIVFPVSYKTIGEKIQLIDVKGVALINLTHFSKIKVNGIIFDDISELCQALSEL